jgi:hypothetical protein
VLTQQPKRQLQGEHEWKKERNKQTCVKYKTKHLNNDDDNKIVIITKIEVISDDNSSSSNNNSIQFFIIYVPSQQIQGQLDAAHCTYNYTVDKHNIKSKTNYGQALEEKHISAVK